VGSGNILTRRPLALTLFSAILFLPNQTRARGLPQEPKAAQTSDFDSIVKSAGAYRDAGNISAAIQAYHRALQLRPDWEEGWWYVGTLNYNAEHYPEAIGAFRRLVALAPQGAPGWEFLGLCEFETKDYSNALAHLQKGTSLAGGQDPELVRVVNYHLALLLIRNGAFEKASELIHSTFGQGEIPAQAKAALGLAFLRVPLLPREIDPSKEALIEEAGGSADSLADGDTKAALESLSKMIGEYPDTPYLHYGYGLALAAEGQLQKAMQEMREEIRLSPESAWPWIELAKLDIEEKEAKEAVSAARLAVRLAPDSAAAHRALSNALEAAGEKRQASLEMETAKKLSPEKGTAELRIARLYENPGERVALSSPAASGGGSANASAGGDFEAISREAVNAQDSGDTAKAMSLYKEALQLRPDWDEGRWNLAMLDYTASRYRETVEELKGWLARNPESGTGWGVLGLSEFALHDYDNALIHLQRGQNLGFGADRNAVRIARYHLGILLIRNSQFDRARELLGPEAGGPTLAPEIQFAMGLAILRIPMLPYQVKAAQKALIEEAGAIAQLLESSKYDEAYPRLQELLREYPDTPFLHYVYGTALASFSRYDEAETQFREEMRISPKSELPLLGLVSVLLEARRGEEALPYARKAVLLAPDSANAHYFLGRTLLETDQAEAALPELLTARRLSPQSPEVHFTLARAYTKTKQPKKASEERALFLQLRAEANEQRKIRQGPAIGGFQRQDGPSLESGTAQKPPREPK
jgi:tetratricopeptide (TPR) repeat protein